MSDQDNFCVVGIGASAGGFEALTTFFKTLPEKTGAAYVIIQHLSPTHDSQVDKILSNFTPMPVTKVKEQMPLEPNQVYVIPENKKLKVNQQGLLYLEERSTARIPNLSIDVFFESMANVYGERAVGIVLSGTGSDGARGVQTIKARGGMVMVQSPESATFDSMPNVSISSDHPDYIFPPETLAQELAHYLKSPDILNKEKLKKEVASSKRDVLKEIIQLISSYSGVNFSSYKPGTIIRRIEKRMKVNHLEKLEEYEKYLQQHPKEVRHVFDDLLIGVTRFFRDAEAWKSLENKVVPQLCYNRTSFEPVRIWVTSCSTGEEAYSLAILFDEYITRHKLNVEFKIFATDVNQRAIDIASMGRYSNAIEEDLGSERLRRYFNPMGDFFEVKKEIRRRIIFSKHNLLSDPPFIRLDLVSCRNLFIYLNDETQDKVLHNFSYALNEGGILCLGVNESNNEQETLFEAVDAKNKIFRNKASTNSRLYRPVANQFQEAQYLQQAPPSYRHRVSAPIKEEAYADLLAERFAPPSLLVNQQEDVVYTTGNLQKYLQFPNRRSDLNVYSMLRGNLLLVFRSGIRQIQEGKQKVIFADTLIENGEEKFSVDVVFSRLNKHQMNQGTFLALIEFHEKEKLKKGDEGAEVITRDKYSQTEIENLEKELKLARRELHFTADELETINEELQSSNEEMQSANEELQSTNEELQSSNEELQTVNTELKNKIDALTILHDDMLNLFNSTQIATIFLDSAMNIRKFTPPAKEYFNIREADIGRPINHYSYNFNYAGFEKVIQEVLEHLQPVEQEVEHKEGNYSIMRVLPYKTESRQIKGVVITFTDITELKQKNNKLRRLSEELFASEQHLQSLLDNTPDLIARFNRELKFTFVNKALLEVSGLNSQDFKGRDSRDLAILDESDAKKRLQLLHEVLQTGKEQEYYFTLETPTAEKHYFTRLIPEFNQEKEIQSILSISTDITELKRAERKIVSNNEQLSEMFDRMDNFVHAIAHDLRAPLVNLKMLAQLIASEEDPEQQDELMGEVSNSVQKLDNTLNGLVQIIEIDNEQEIKTESIVLEEKLQQVKSDLMAKIEATGATIETDFSEAPTISYIPPYLESILKNLLSNALKYRSPERKPLVQVRSERRKQFVVLTIEDNGRGIDMEEHGGNLFKPFKRFHAETEGMGVGLYVIKYMVAKNGGFIEVDSKVEEGSAFRVFLKPYPESINKALTGDLQ